MLWRVLQWAARLFLGAMFVYASYQKLKQPFLFEMAVDSYQILPYWAVIVVARTLPWLEMALGLLLLSGWKLAYLATFAALLIGFFLGMMALSYHRGVAATCGCFGFGEPVGPWTLTRDSMIFMVTFYLAVYSWMRCRLPPGKVLEGIRARQVP